MRKSIYIPTVRPDSLNRFFKSVVELNLLQDWNFFFYFQCYTKQNIRELFSKYGHLISGYLESDKRVAPYVARCELMKTYKSDIYCVNDDDAVLMNLLDYNTPVQKILQDHKCGMISTNWVRVNTPKMMAQKRYEREFKKQNLINTGGGLLFSDKVLKTSILNQPILPYLYDDIALSLNAYVGGWNNYRYLGSIIEHNAVMNGGIKTLYKERSMQLLDSRFIDMKKTTSIYPHENNNYHMPTSKNITEYAHKLHKENSIKI